MGALQATCSLLTAAALGAWVPALARAAIEPPLEPLPAAAERRPAISQAQLVQGQLVQGELVTGRQRLVLSHGAALLHDGAEGLDGGGPRLRVLLSESPVDPTLLQGVLPQLRLGALGRSGGLRGLLLEVDPAALEQVQISLVVPPVAGAPPSVASLSLYSSGGPGPGAFASFALEARRLRAAFSHARASSMAPAPDDIRSISFQVDLPVQAEPAVTARVEGGDAVRATPQGRLALERARSMASLDAAGLARLRAEDPSAVASDPGQPSDSTLLPLLRELGAAQLKGLGGAGLLLVERGDRAVLVIEEAEGLRSWINFHRRNGVWQIGEPPVPSARGLAG